ncbi:acetoacetate--CoA ligase [Geodermatophilus sp. SYSU D00815]
MTLAAAAPHRPAGQLADFRARCEMAAGHALPTPGALHRFSVEHPAAFWRTLLDWSELPWSGSADVVLTGEDVETARFFPDVRLNYAEALLRPLPGADDDSPALTAVHADRRAETWTRGRLRADVRRTAAALAGAGLRAGDRVVLVAPHSGSTVVVGLAVAALGAALSTAAPDMGAGTLLGRFEQVEPALAVLDRSAMAPDTVAAVLAGLPTLRRALVLDDEPLPAGDLPVDRLADLPAGPAGEPGFERFPFDAPLFVMFSSGTTGPPKAMVHGAGGTLLEHVKELRLHVDLGAGDTLYFHTTTAWMMWNWQLSALAVGARIVVNDAPVTGPESLWRLVGEHGVTVFGTSPAYLQLCQDAGYRPAGAVDLSRLRAVLSTGAVLHDWQFDWVADAVGPVPLQSISGGTDIIGCFVLGSPEVPVRRGRCSARSLGLDVAAVDADGREVVGAVGELVCRRPFPSRPIGFLRDPDGSRFHAAYFAAHPGTWTHGDLVDFDEDGTARLHGRSDGVLNVDGVRIGPSEIYTVLRSMPEVADAMAVEQRDLASPGSSRMVLLLVLRDGVVLDAGLERTVRRRLRAEASAAHVPSLVLAVPELPMTHNGKKSERAARDAVNGDAVPNLSALRNPGCLEAIRAAAAGRRECEAPARPAPATAAPADEVLLREVTRIWCEVLGRRDADPGDDFSDLGGTSRQVLSLLRRVRLELGADVPVQEFAADPTPGGLARAAAAAPAGATEHSPLLRSGHGRPVFLVADAWGQLNLYGGLVERLVTDRPVRGLRLPLVDAGGRHRTVPELAEEAVARLREVQPEGPYSLLGYSFGGIVAYAAATALRRDGAAVGFLGLVDVLPPAAALTRTELRARGWARRLERARQLLRRPWRRAVAADTGAGATEAEFFAGSERVVNAFRPEPFDGAVTYYLAQGRLPIVGNSLAGWRRVAPHLLVTEVPGHHMDLDEERTGVLGGRHVGTLAARVSATLR